MDMHELKQLSNLYLGWSNRGVVGALVQMMGGRRKRELLIILCSPDCFSPSLLILAPPEAETAERVSQLHAPDMPMAYILTM